MGSHHPEGRAGARPSVYFITLGCAKNEVDTRDMQESLVREGMGVACCPEECDAVVVNTCSFIRPAIEESLDAIFEVADMESVKGRGVPVVVAGCMPSRFGDDLVDELTEASAFVPCSDEHDIARIVRECLGSAGGEASVPAEACASPEDASDGPAGEGRPLQAAGPVSAYVKISDGCDRFCSYCTIPFIRGAYHSFPLEQVVQEAGKAISDGAREIVLIGQDTGLWGTDFNPPSSLAGLLDHLSALHPDVWFRAMYTQPQSVTDELLDVLASRENVAPYLDVPLQHCVPRILKDMNREGSSEQFAALVAKAREKVPGIAIRTTLIAGFPGETEDDFDELVAFVEEEAFDYVGVFPYSREEGTASFSLPGQVDEDEKEYRAERLRTVADAVSSAVVAGRVGCAMPVLVEGVEEDGQLFGRAIVQAPEVDGVTYVDGGEPGSIVACEVEDTLMYDMEAVRL